MLDQVLYDFTSAAVQAGLIIVIAVIVGLAVRKPIPLWACLLASIAPLVIFVLVPLANLRMDVLGGLIGTICFMLLLYFLPKRKKKGE